MTSPTDEPTDQTEFIFSADFRRPRGVASPLRRSGERGTLPLVRPPRRRRGVAPTRQRLPISAEAFASPASDRGIRRPRDAARYGGLLEAAVAILATMAFGLAWAAYELDFDFRSTASPRPPASLAGGYAVVAPMTSFGLAGAEEAEWTTMNADGRGFTPTDESSAR